MRIVDPSFEILDRRNLSVWQKLEGKLLKNLLLFSVGIFSREVIMLLLNSTTFTFSFTAPSLISFLMKRLKNS